MTTTINADNGVVSGSAGLKETPDSSGILALQTNGVTAVTIDGSQNATFAGSIPSVGGYPSYQCRAWVNFNGTGTVAIRASGNVSSITDNGTGNYTVNFTTAMPDANYSFPTSVSYYDANTQPVNPAFAQGGLRAISSVRIYVGVINSNLTAWAAFDAPNICVAIFR